MDQTKEDEKMSLKGGEKMKSNLELFKEKLRQIQRSVRNVTSTGTY